MESYQPPASSVAPEHFGLRFSLPDDIPHYRTPLHPTSFLLRAALICPDKWAIVHPEKKYRFTYSQWAARTLSLAFALKSIPGWKRGDRVAVVSPNCPLILEAHNAIPALGGVITPINIRNTPKEVAYVLSHSGSSIVLVDYEFKHLVPSPPPQGVTVIVSHDSGGQDKNDPYEAFLSQGRKEWDRAETASLKRGEQYPRGWQLLTLEADEETAVALCYTSGTTGAPKGVSTSARGCYLSAISNVLEAQIDRESVYLWTLPAFHATGWTFTWAINAACAQHLVIRKVDNGIIWKHLLHGGVTHYAGAPTVQIGLVNHPDARKIPDGRIVRVAVAASAPTAQLLGQMESLGLFPVHVYGLTETYGPFTRRYSHASWSELSHENRARQAARQGHAYLASDEARVVRPLASETPADAPLEDVRWDGKEVGEIVMRGNMAMLGYYKDEEATRKVIKNGWFHTGDLAVREPDGAIFIQDRGKDIIISGGENISSLAVETELSTHPDVLECSVVARAHPKWGERGHAFVTLKESAPKKDDWEQALKTHMRGKVSGFAIPEWIELVDALPKTSTGKVQKNVLRDELKKRGKESKL